MALKKQLIIGLCICIVLLRYADTKCHGTILSSFPFVLEYAVWRGWSQAFIHTTDMESGCNWAVLRLVKCLGVNGVASVLNAIIKPNVYARIGVIIVSPKFHQNWTEKFKEEFRKLHDVDVDVAWIDWLVIARSSQDFKDINQVLVDTAIRFDENLVVAFPLKNEHLEQGAIGLCDDNFVYKTRDFYSTLYSNICRNHNNSNCLKSVLTESYYRRTKRFKNLARHSTYSYFNRDVRLFNSAILNYNYSRIFDMRNASILFPVVDWRNTKHKDNQKTGIYLMQYFKVRINSTLYVSYLGKWDRKRSMAHVSIPFPVEARNFLGEQFIFGRSNFTEEAGDFLDEDKSSAPALLDDLVYFLAIRLNATSSTRYYNKLGFRTYEGSWTGLLGALMDTSVDIALEPVTSHTSRHQDMDFIFPIAQTMCNIYIRDQETSAVRDIFLAPFSPSLIACVVAVALAFAIAILLISRLTPSLTCEASRMGYTEALIWSTGILFQQGGSNTPLNPAARVLLIACLLYATVTYNSYAAFITSVLSVRVASVDTVSAVLHSPDLKIGYIRNGPDQMYLMSTKDLQLNAFYIRGYSEAENLVSSAEEGLLRAARQDYAFFSEQRTARNTLRSFSQARGRCSLRELPVSSTRAHIAFPVIRGSPYSRPILLSLLQLRSSGVLARLEAALMPGMPRCASPRRFASARATDVKSALVLFLVGLFTAIIIGFGEYCWNKRDELWQSSTVRCKRLFNT